MAMSKREIIPWGPEDIDQDSDALKYVVLHIPAGLGFKVENAYCYAQADVAKANTAYNTLFLRNNSETAAEICRLENGDATNGTSILQSGGGARFGTGTQAAFVAGAMNSLNQVVGSASAATELILSITKTGAGLAIAGLRVFVIGRWLPVNA